MRNKLDLEASLHALAADARRELGAPPTPEELLAYHRGELDREAEERLRELLAVSPESVRELLDLTAHSGVVSEADHRSEQDLRASWQQLEARLRAEEPQETGGGVVVRFPARNPLKPARLWQRLPLAAAAVFALVSVGLGGWVAMLREQVAALGAPKVSFHRQVLQSSEHSKGSGEPPAVLASDAAEHLLVLVLNDDRGFESYRLEILDADHPAGEPRWRRDGLERQPDGTFELLLPHGFLPSGKYLLRLYGLGDGASRPLADYWIKL